MSDTAEPKLTPMMQQYRDMKAVAPEGSLLCFRLGDFYETFNEDAQVVSKALELTLTKRNGVLMCGFPYHSVDRYTQQLVESGHQVALCEITSNPSPGEIAKREITQVLRPPEPTKPLPDRLRELAPELVEAAQDVYNAWEQDANGDDVEFGTGGICSAITQKWSDILAGADIGSSEGGHDGDDHSWLVCFDSDRNAATLDIPSGVYESGSGYRWVKVPGVVFCEKHLLIGPLEADHLDEDDFNNFFGDEDPGISM